MNALSQMRRPMVADARNLLAPMQAMRAEPQQNMLSMAPQTGAQPFAAQPSGQGGNPSGDAIVAGLVQRGLPEHVARGFAANFYAESNWDPGINEIEPVVPGSRGGFGLAQWTGPRRVAFEQYAQRRGAPLDDVETQLDFLMMELSGPERAAAARIMQTGTPEEATRAISDLFLRPGVPRMDARMSGLRKLSPDITAAIFGD